MGFVGEMMYARDLPGLRKKEAEKAMDYDRISTEYNAGRRTEVELDVARRAYYAAKLARELCEDNMRF